MPECKDLELHKNNGNVSTFHQRPVHIIEEETVREVLGSGLVANP